MLICIERARRAKEPVSIKHYRELRYSSEYSPRNFIAFLSRTLEIQNLLTVKYPAYYERTAYIFCERGSQLRRSCSDSIFNQPAHPYFSITLDLISPWQQTSAKLSPQYFQTLARWHSQIFRDDCAVCRNKTVRGSGLSRYQYLTRQDPRWIWDHLLLHCWRFGNTRWLMRLRAIRSYHQTPCRDTYLHLSRGGCMQIWEPSPTSKAKYQ